MRSKKAVYNIISTLILQIIAIIYGFIVPKIIIKSFGSNVNGLVSSITQFLAYITLLESGVGPLIRASLYKPLANKNKQDIANIPCDRNNYNSRYGSLFCTNIKST